MFFSVFFLRRSSSSLKNEKSHPCSPRMRQRRQLDHMTVRVTVERRRRRRWRVCCNASKNALFAAACSLSSLARRGRMLRRERESPRAPSLDARGRSRAPSSQVSDAGRRGARPRRAGAAADGILCQRRQRGAARRRSGSGTWEPAAAAVLSARRGVGEVHGLVLVAVVGVRDRACSFVKGELECGEKEKKG